MSTMRHGATRGRIGRMGLVLIGIVALFGAAACQGGRTRRREGARVRGVGVCGQAEGEVPLPDASGVHIGHAG